MPQSKDCTERIERVGAERALEFARRLQSLDTLDELIHETERELAESLGGGRVVLVEGSGSERAAEPRRNARSLATTPLVHGEVEFGRIELGDALGTGERRVHVERIADQLAAALARVRAARTFEVRAVRARCESASLLVGTFTHELKNLLTVVAWRAEALRGAANARAAKLGVGDVDVEAVDSIAEAARRAGEGVRRWLGFARRVEATPEPLELVGFVDELAQRIQDWQQDRESVTTAHALGAARVLVDRSALAALVVELALLARALADRDVSIGLCVREARDGEFEPREASEHGAPSVVLEIDCPRTALSRAALERATERFCPRRTREQDGSCGNDAAPARGGTPNTAENRVATSVGPGAFVELARETEDRTVVALVLVRAP
ncbi:MAG: hypothetical protein L6Q99_02025 [Planctomycetes bacterium]|nr:hypothetical protein [Planctomycetota bacterium]